MKRIAVLILAAAVLCACFLSAWAEEDSGTVKPGLVGKVTTKKGPLNMWAKAEAGSVVRAKIPNGTCLLVLEEGAEWCLCEWNGSTGYCSAEFVTILRGADVSLLGYRVLREGDSGGEVLALMRRLQELDYIRGGSTLTSAYNDILSERIALFQRQAGMTEDGIASQELQAYLFSEGAPVCTQTLPKVRSQVLAQNGEKRVICGCCFGDGCECCHFTGWITY